MEIRDISTFLDYLTSAHGRTRRVVMCIPPDELEWAPAPGRFSFGDIVRHLAGIERWMYGETVRGLPSRYPGHGRELADGFPAVLEYYDRLHAESRAIFGALDAAALAAKCETPAGTPITTWKWLRAMLEHEAHHRGQLYLMLALRGVPTPPLYGLTSEEVRARSA
ncbi:MAG TPA: DinB family protein [Gemmatimonadaceae bacterium]|nr:DinB family protein [Gemmatimonadaceae bacterium]